MHEAVLPQTYLLCNSSDTVIASRTVQLNLHGAETSDA
jgi:hypothetical protein